MDPSRFSDSFPPKDAEPPIDPLKAFRLLRSAGGALFTQVALHGQLARVEWADEKRRLQNILVAALVGFAFALCVLIFVGIIVLAATWDTVYRVPAILALTVVYVIGFGVAWHRVRSLSALSGQAFAATREEIVADIAMFKSRL